MSESGTAPGMAGTRKEPEYTSYSTRKMRVDLHRQVKALAGSRGKTMEEMLNEVIQTGLLYYQQPIG